MVKSNQALDQWSSTDEIFKPAYPLGHTWLAWPNCIIHFINDHTWLTWSNRIIHLIINDSQGKIVSSTWSFMIDMVKPDNPLDYPWLTSSNQNIYMIIDDWHGQTGSSTWSFMFDMVISYHTLDHPWLTWSTVSSTYSNYQWLTSLNQIIHMIIHDWHGQIVSSTWSPMANVFKPGYPLDQPKHGQTIVWPSKVDKAIPLSARSKDKHTLYVVVRVTIVAWTSDSGQEPNVELLYNV